MEEGEWDYTEWQTFRIFFTLLSTEPGYIVGGGITPKSWDNLLACVRIPPFLHSLLPQPGLAPIRGEGLTKKWLPFLTTLHLQDPLATTGFGSNSRLCSWWISVELDMCVGVGWGTLLSTGTLLNPSGVHSTAKGNGINLQRGTWNFLGNHSAQHRQFRLCSKTIKCTEPAPTKSSSEQPWGGFLWRPLLSSRDAGASRRGAPFPGWAVV